MNEIKELPQELINKISAGEVIERPSSVVKELVENSIDAKSSIIDINIRNGGKTEIRVSDNGIGINSKDVKLAFKRHATSKLADFNLSKIRTLGFRGEALSSIASISRMKIYTSISDIADGKSFEVNSGLIGELKPSPRKIGTTIEVNELFYTTPARLKFLKTENYETLLIKQCIQKLALSNPDIEFNFYSNKKKIISSLASNNPNFNKKLEHRIVSLFGSEFFKNVIWFNEKIDCYNFYGFIGLPTFHHSNNAKQFTFVNKRPVHDRYLYNSIKAAYKDFLSYDKYPQVVLFINCPFEDVDINVHPTKNEVRFKNMQNLRSLLIRSIRKGLELAGHKSSTVNTFKTLDTINKNNNNLNLLTKNVEDSFLSNNSFNAENTGDLTEEICKDYPLGLAKSQFHETYIISQTKNGIVIIDQHAAHERIVYEKLKKNYNQNNLETQILLIPEIIEVISEELDILLNHRDFLARYSLLIEKFSNESIIVREVPLILINCNISLLMKDIISDLIEIGDSQILETNINKICSSMACHGSIRAGRHMYQDEMNKLLREMESTPFSGQCNHGRPTYIELNLNQIESLFGRK